jgi:hypothetical protein
VCSGIELEVNNIGVVKVDAISEVRTPLSTNRSIICYSPPSKVPALSQTRKTTNADCGEGSSDPYGKSTAQNVSLGPQPTQLGFHEAHCIAVEEDPESTVQVQLPRRRKWARLGQSTYGNLFGVDREPTDDIKNKTEEQDDFESTETASSHLSDPEWLPQTEFSPSSCEYLSHSESSTEGRDSSYSAFLPRRRQTPSRSTSPIPLTPDLRSGKTRRASDEAKITASRAKKVLVQHATFYAL